MVKFASPSCVRFISFWLSASHGLRLGMDGMLLGSVTTGSRDRACLPLIILIIGSEGFRRIRCILIPRYNDMVHFTVTSNFVFQLFFSF